MHIPLLVCICGSIFSLFLLPTASLLCVNTFTGSSSSVSADASLSYPLDAAKWDYDLLGSVTVDSSVLGGSLRFGEGCDTDVNSTKNTLFNTRRVVVVIRSNNQISATPFSLLSNNSIVPVDGVFDGTLFHGVGLPGNYYTSTMTGVVVQRLKPPALTTPSSIIVNKTMPCGTFIADRGANRIICMTFNIWNVTRVVVGGTNSTDFNGDNAQGTLVNLNYPNQISFGYNATLGAVCVYIADVLHHRIRLYNTVTNATFTVAGSAAGDGVCLEGGSPLACDLLFPHGVTVSEAGNIYIADTYHAKIRMINVTGGGGGGIYTIFGTGSSLFTGDGGSALLGSSVGPTKLAYRDSDATLFFTERGSSRLRMLASSVCTESLFTSGVAIAQGLGGDGVTAFEMAVSTRQYPATSGCFFDPAIDAPSNWSTVAAANGFRFGLVKVGGLTQNTKPGAGIGLPFAECDNSSIKVPAGLASTDHCQRYIRLICSYTPDGTGSVAFGDGIWAPAAIHYLAYPSPTGALVHYGSQYDSVRRNVCVGSLNPIPRAPGYDGAAGEDPMRGAAYGRPMQDSLLKAANAIAWSNVTGSIYLQIDEGHLAVIDAFPGMNGGGTSRKVCLVPFRGTVCNSLTADDFRSATSGGTFWYILCASYTNNAVYSIRLDDTPGVCSQSTPLTAVFAGYPRGTPTVTGDGGFATSASLARPSIALRIGNGLWKGNTLIGDMQGGTVRMVDSGGIIRTIVGVPNRIGMTYDGFYGNQSLIGVVGSLAWDSRRSILYISDLTNYRIWSYAAMTGVLQTVIGTGLPNTGRLACGTSFDITVASRCIIGQISSLAVDADGWGNVYLLDDLSGAVLEYLPTEGLVVAVAGQYFRTGAEDAADGDFASFADFSGAKGLAATRWGVEDTFEVYVAAADGRIRVLSLAQCAPRDGSLSTIGTGGSTRAITPLEWTSSGYSGYLSLGFLAPGDADFPGRRTNLCLWNPSNTTHSPETQAADAGYMFAISTYGMRPQTSEYCTSYSLSIPAGGTPSSNCQRSALLNCSFAPNSLDRGWGNFVAAGFFAPDLSFIPQYGGAVYTSFQAICINSITAANGTSGGGAYFRAPRIHGHSDAYNMPVKFDYGITRGIDGRSVALICDSAVILIDGGTNQVLYENASGIIPALLPGAPPSYTLTANSTSGDMYLVHPSNHTVQLLSWQDGYIALVAGIPGNPSCPPSGAADYSPLAYNLNAPSGAAVKEVADTFFNATLFLASTGNHQIVALDLATGRMRLLLGSRSCSPGYGGDSGAQVLNVSLHSPTGLALDDGRYLYISDSGNGLIRRYSMQYGTMETLVGQKGAPGGNCPPFSPPARCWLGTPGRLVYNDVYQILLFSATSWPMSSPRSNTSHGLYFYFDSDYYAPGYARVHQLAQERQLYALDGTLLPEGDGGDLSDASMGIIQDLMVSADGNSIYIADAASSKLRRIDRTTCTDGKPDTLQGYHVENLSSSSFVATIALWSDMTPGCLWNPPYTGIYPPEWWNAFFGYRYVVHYMGLDAGLLQGPPVNCTNFTLDIPPNAIEAKDNCQRFARVVCHEFDLTPLPDGFWSLAFRFVDANDTVTYERFQVEDPIRVGAPASPSASPSSSLSPSPAVTAMQATNASSSLSPSPGIAFSFSPTGSSPPLTPPQQNASATTTAMTTGTIALVASGSTLGFFLLLLALCCFSQWFIASRRRSTMQKQLDDGLQRARAAEAAVQLLVSSNEGGDASKVDGGALSEMEVMGRIFRASVAPPPTTPSGTQQSFMCGNACCCRAEAAAGTGAGPAWKTARLSVSLSSSSPPSDETTAEQEQLCLTIRDAVLAASQEGAAAQAMASPSTSDAEAVSPDAMTLLVNSVLMAATEIAASPAAALPESAQGEGGGGAGSSYIRLILAEVLSEIQACETAANAAASRVGLLRATRSEATGKKSSVSSTEEGMKKKRLEFSSVHVSPQHAITHAFSKSEQRTMKTIDTAVAAVNVLEGGEEGLEYGESVMLTSLGQSDSKRLQHKKVAGGQALSIELIFQRQGAAKKVTGEPENVRKGASGKRLSQVQSTSFDSKSALGKMQAIDFTAAAVHVTEGGQEIEGVEIASSSSSATSAAPLRRIVERSGGASGESSSVVKVAGTLSASQQRANIQGNPLAASSRVSAFEFDASKTKDRATFRMLSLQERITAVGTAASDIKSLPRAKLEELVRSTLAISSRVLAENILENVSAEDAALLRETKEVALLLEDDDAMEQKSASPIPSEMQAMPGDSKVEMLQAPAKPAASQKKAPRHLSPAAMESLAVAVILKKSLRMEQQGFGAVLAWIASFLCPLTRQTALTKGGRRPKKGSAAGTGVDEEQSWFSAADSAAFSSPQSRRWKDEGAAGLGIGVSTKNPKIGGTADSQLEKYLALLKRQQKLEKSTPRMKYSDDNKASSKNDSQQGRQREVISMLIKELDSGLISSSSSSASSSTSLENIVEPPKQSPSATASISSKDLVALQPIVAARVSAASASSSARVLLSKEGGLASPDVVRNRESQDILIESLAAADTESVPSNLSRRSTAANLLMTGRPSLLRDRQSRRDAAADLARKSRSTFSPSNTQSKESASVANDTAVMPSPPPPPTAYRSTGSFVGASSGRAASSRTSASATSVSADDVAEAANMRNRSPSPRLGGGSGLAMDRGRDSFQPISPSRSFTSSGLTARIGEQLASLASRPSVLSPPAPSMLLSSPSPPTSLPSSRRPLSSTAAASPTTASSEHLLVLNVNRAFRSVSPPPRSSRVVETENALLSASSRRTLVPAEPPFEQVAASNSPPSAAPLMGAALPPSLLRDRANRISRSGSSAPLTSHSLLRDVANRL